MYSSPILCIAGPTAAGKSAASLALSQHWPIEIINVDSATIYQGMDIGTAKPSLIEQKQIPHHLLDICLPSESYSAAQFRDDALANIAAIQARGNIPVLCGGTMLYYKILREGINTLPKANAEIRNQIDQQAQEKGWPAMHELLAQYDPASAARLKPNDSQRIQRALEIFYSSGRPMSDWLSRPLPASSHSYTFYTLALEPSDRIQLHHRIYQRFHAMLEQGLLNEVATLYADKSLHTGLPAIRCVGYRQLWDYFEGHDTLAQATEKAITATRQLAKRQLTWLRSQPERTIIDCLAKEVSAQVVDIQAQLLNKPK